MASKSSTKKETKKTTKKSQAKTTKKTNTKTKTKTAKPQTKKNTTAKKGKKKGIIALIVVVVILAALGIVGYFYYRQSEHYKQFFYNGTIINGVDCSEMTLVEARSTIQHKLNEYTFTFTDHEGNSTTVTAPELEVTYLDNGEVEQLLAAQNTMMWVFENDKTGKYTVTSGYTYNEEKLRGWVGMLPCVTDGVAPTDAYERQKEDGFWEIVPETYGDKLDEEALYAIIKEAVDQAKPEANLEGIDLFYKPAVLSDDESLTASVEEKNNAILAAIRRAEIIEEITDVDLIFYSYHDVIHINKDRLSKWIIDDENGDPVIDEVKVKEWVKYWAIGRGIDQNPNLFLTHDGKVVEVGEGVMGGWVIDQEATMEKAWQQVKNRESGWFYPVLVDYNGVPLSQTSYVEINISKQTMWYYQDGKELVETPIVTGNTANGYDTPSNGVWYIYAKMTNYTMVGPRLADGTPEYTAYVNFWMPFNGQIGIHDMQTRDAFGGTIYQGAGSHGCVNTPYDAVKVIFENAAIGTPVVVHS